MHVSFYDKSFEGLLCVVFEAYRTKNFPQFLLAHGEIAPMLMTSNNKIVTEEDKGLRVFTALKQKLSATSLRDLLHVWLSEYPESDKLLFDYIRLIIDSGPGAEHNLRQDVVLQVSALARKVMAERHLMTGFVRFQKTISEVYVGLLAPKYNVLTLMLEYFSIRFADQKWILYDTKRKFGFFYDAGQFHEVHLDEDIFDGNIIREEFLDNRELWFQNSWRNYCSSLSIKERFNPTLQRRCMPARYWKYMVEMCPAPAKKHHTALPKSIIKSCVEE